jgi:ABC-type glycerol-3-phosphate transport system substrate-binding protein
MWVGGQGAIVKLRAADGSVQATTPFIGLTLSMAFDGTSIWAVQSAGTQVSQLRASDGSFVGAFDAGHGTRCVIFDGANIWVSNSSDNTISKM